MRAITASSDDEMQSEIERLRAENERLRQQLAQRVPDGHVVIPLKLAASCLSGMKDAIRWERDRDGRPPSQVLCFEIQDFEAALSAAPAQPAPPAGTPAAFSWPLKTDGKQQGAQP